MLTADTNPIGCLFLDAAARYRDQAALRLPDRDISYARLRAVAVDLARRYRAEGIGRDSLVGLNLSAAEGTGAIASVLALTLLGAPWMQYALYPRGLPISLTHLLHDGSARATGGRLLAVDMRPLLQAALDAPDPEDLEDLVGYRSADDTWALSASSGTTGTPKCMQISAAMFRDRMDRLKVAWERPPGYTATDLFSRTSNMGVTNVIHTLLTGGVYLLSTDFDYLVAQAVDVLVGSPALLATFLDGRSPAPEPALREVHVGGALISPVFFARLLQHFQSVTVRYGATETGPVCCRTRATADDPGSVGAPFADVDVEIVAADGSPAAPGVEGTVRIRTSSAVKGYLGDSETSAATFRDGWFYPGDRGFLSTAGELVVSGRTEDQLNVSGTKVNAAYIDECMQAAEGVADALCFEELDGEGVVRLAALVCLDPAAADRKAVLRNLLKTLLRQELHPSSLPTNVYLVTEIPRNPNGKAMRHQAAAIAKGRKPAVQFGRRA